MSDSLQIFGKTYTGVTGIVAKDTSAADITYVKMVEGSATTPSITISTTPTISFNSSTGAFSVSVAGSSSITPTVSSGFVTNGSAGVVTVSGSSSYQLTTKTAATIIPTTSDQTIPSGRYLTGVQTIKGDTNLVASNIISGASIFGVTGTAQTGGTIQPLSVTDNGTYIASGSIDGYSPVTVNVSGGSTPASDAVRFIDYDASVVYAYSAADFLALTSMPANPSHARLVAQGWNWDLADAQEYVGQWGYLDIGQTYITASGDTELDIDFPSDSKRLSPYLGLAVKGEVEVDWGDNSSKTTVTGTSLTTQINTQHTYSSPGEYTISIHLVSGSFCFYSSSTSRPTLNFNTSNNNTNRVYALCLKAVYIGNNSINNTIGNNAFYGCYNLKYITIPKKLDGITSFIIGSNSLTYCFSLKCLILPKQFNGSVGCSEDYSLEYILIPKEDTYLPVLSNNYSLKSYIMPSLAQSSATNTLGAKGNQLYFLERLIIPSKNYKSIPPQYNAETILVNQTEIKNYQFDSMTDLINCTIPSSINSIGGYAFYGCLGLRDITLPNVTALGNSTFANCVALDSIDISKITTLNTISTFSGCYSLKQVTMPSASILTDYSLGTQYFSSCYSLQNISLPSNITEIGNNVFYYCYCLRTITLPNSLTKIGTSALSYTTGLSNITIPASVTQIDANAFNGCYGMKEYHLLPTTPPTLGNTVFQYIPSDCIIYVPYSADHSVLNAYKTATNWSTYASYIQEEPQ